MKIGVKRYFACINNIPSVELTNILKIRYQNGFVFLEHLSVMHYLHLVQTLPEAQQANLVSNVLVYLFNMFDVAQMETLFGWLDAQSPNLKQTVFSTLNLNDKTISQAAKSVSISRSSLQALNLMTRFPKEILLIFLNNLMLEALYQFNGTYIAFLLNWMAQQPDDLKQTVLSDLKFDASDMKEISFHVCKQILRDFLAISDQLPSNIALIYVGHLGHILYRDTNHWSDLATKYIQFIQKMDLEKQKTILKHPYGSRTLAEQMDLLSLVDILRHWNGEDIKELLLEADTHSTLVEKIMYKHTLGAFDFNGMDKDPKVINAYLSLLINKLPSTDRVMLLDAKSMHKTLHHSSSIYLYLLCLDDASLTMNFSKNKRDDVLEYIKTIKNKDEQEVIQRLIRNPESALHQFMEDAESSNSYVLFACYGRNWHIKQIQALQRNWSAQNVPVGLSQAPMEIEMSSGEKDALLTTVRQRVTG